MSGVVLDRGHWYAALARRWNRAWGDPSDAAPVIYVRRASGPGWWVVVEPHCGITSVSFHTHAEAVERACELRRVRGWDIIVQRHEVGA